MLQQGQTLRRKEAVTSEAENAESDTNESDDVQMNQESTSRKVTLEDVEGSSSEDEASQELEKVVDPDVEDDLDDDAVSDKSGSRKHQKSPENLQINPSQYMVVESQRRKDSGEAKVAMAFAGDDDVVAEFAAEKRKVIERERPKDIDLRLPGWGEWSGPGIKQSQRRKKRLAILYLHYNFV